MSEWIEKVGRLEWQLGTALNQRDELARQLEEARRLACHYHELLHLAHERPFIIERDGRTR